MAPLTTKQLLSHTASLLSCHPLFAPSAPAPAPAPAPHRTLLHNDTAHVLHSVPAPDVHRIPPLYHNPLLHSDTDLLNLYLDLNLDIDDESDRVFLEEVLTGAVRYHRIVQPALEAVYQACNRLLLKSERPLYAALAYLCLFRLHELSWPQLKRLLWIAAGPDPTKMACFVRVLFDPQNLRPRGALYERWAKLLDVAWLQEHVIEPLSSYLDHGVALAAEMTERAHKGMVIVKGESKKTGVCAMPRADALESLKLHNRQLARDKLAAATLHAPKVASLKKPKPDPDPNHVSASDPHSTPLVLSESTTIRARPPPSSLHDPPSHPIKLTAASILRDRAVLLRRTVRPTDASVAGDREIGLVTDEEYARWRAERRRQEAELEAVEREKRRLEVVLARENGAEKRDEVAKENRERAALVHAEAEELRKRAGEEEQREMEENKRKREVVVEGRDNSRKAMEKVKQENARIVSDLDAQSAAMIQVAKEAAEAERCAKAQLIKEIRALERQVPPAGSVVKKVDLDETSGVGLLSEMCVAELTARLSLAREQAAQLAEQRRLEIAAQRSSKATLLEEMRESVEKEREDMMMRRKKEQEEREREEREAKAAAAADEVGKADKELLQMRRLVEEKKRARLAARDLERQQMLALVSKPSSRTSSLTSTRISTRSPSRTGLNAPPPPGLPPSDGDAKKRVPGLPPATTTTTNSEHPIVTTTREKGSSSSWVSEPSEPPTSNSSAVSTKPSSASERKQELVSKRSSSSGPATAKGSSRVTSAQAKTQRANGVNQGLAEPGVQVDNESSGGNVKSEEISPVGGDATTHEGPHMGGAPLDNESIPPVTSIHSRGPDGGITSNETDLIPTADVFVAQVERPSSAVHTIPTSAKSNKSFKAVSDKSVKSSQQIKTSASGVRPSSGPMKPLGEKEQLTDDSPTHEPRSMRTIGGASQSEVGI
ncbi:hypothetical protein HDU93_009442 [Gonapodya sp. JEL0774]|nr:hypothetical protein HDU93_009442 [Gonapodya sp. JEL0774]